MQIGDVVVLKSGGPKMTVISIGWSYKFRNMACACSWFNLFNDLQEKEFIFETLKLEGEGE